MEGLDRWSRRLWIHRDITFVTWGHMGCEQRRSSWKRDSIHLRRRWSFLLENTMSWTSLQTSSRVSRSAKTTKRTRHQSWERQVKKVREADVKFRQARPTGHLWKGVAIRWVLAARDRDGDDCPGNIQQEVEDQENPRPQPVTTWEFNTGEPDVRPVRPIRGSSPAVKFPFDLNEFEKNRIHDEVQFSFQNHNLELKKKSDVTVLCSTIWNLQSMFYSLWCRIYDL